MSKARILAVAVIASLMMAIGATSAYAGNCVGSLCGRIYNSRYSNCSLTIFDNWDPVRNIGAGNRRGLAPNHYSTEFFKDTDGYYIPTGCHIWMGPVKGNWYGPRYVKISDGVGYITLTVGTN